MARGDAADWREWQRREYAAVARAAEQGNGIVAFGY